MERLYRNESIAKLGRNIFHTEENVKHCAYDPVQRRHNKLSFYGWVRFIEEEYDGKEVDTYEEKVFRSIEVLEIRLKSLLDDLSTIENSSIDQFYKLTNNVRQVVEIVEIDLQGKIVIR